MPFELILFGVIMIVLVVYVVFKFGSVYPDMAILALLSGGMMLFPESFVALIPAAIGALLYVLAGKYIVRMTVATL